MSRAFSAVINPHTDAKGVIHNSPGQRPGNVATTLYGIATTMLLLGAGFVISVPAQAQTDHAALLQQVKAYHYGGDQAPLVAVEQWVTAARAAADQRRQAAAELATVLQSDAAFDAKQFVCRELVLIAGPEQVPALTRLLQDDALAHYALLALAQIPGDSVNEALRSELPKRTGRAQLEIINVLGERRDAAATVALTDLLQATDAATAEAAAAALAKIADVGALQALRTAYTQATGNRRVAYGRALLGGADRLRAADAAAALPAYATLNANPANAELSAGALRGLMQANAMKSLSLLLDALAQDNTPRQFMALSLARELPGHDLTTRLAERLPKLSATAQTLLIAALRDRGDAAAAPAITPLLRSAEPAVRTAAVDAIGTVGDATTVPALLEIAATAKGNQRDAARASLARLRGATVDAMLMSLLSPSRVPARVEIITTLGQRRTVAAVPRLLQEARSPQPAVSGAAILVLRAMGRPEDVPSLLSLLSTAAPDQRPGVVDAVAEMARRGTGESQRTGAVLDRLTKTTAPAARAELLMVLGRVGGPRALAALQQAADDKAPQVRLAALRLIADWPTDEPLDDLLRAVNTTHDEAQRMVALRGYVRMIGLSDQRTPDEALALYRRAAATANNVEGKRLVLAGVAKLKSLSALEYASSLVGDKDVHAEAEAAVVDIAHSTIGAERDKTRAVLEPIAKNSADEHVRARAREILALADKFGDFVTAWEVSPAYQRDNTDFSKLFDIAFAPEDPAHRNEVPWRLMPAGTNAEQPWLLDLLALWGGEQKVAYLRTTVWSDTPRDVVLELGSDDGVKAWWNGQVVVADNTQRAVAPGQDKVKLHLKAGRNDLMLKITQNVLGWGACARFTNPDGSAVTGLRYEVPPAILTGPNK